MKEKRSYFQIFFLNFILMLIVPMLTILLIFWEANCIVTEQCLNNASKSLERYAELFDVTIEDMSNVCLTIINREECRLYSIYAEQASNEKYIQSYKLNDVLEPLISEKYYDIFVYFHNDNKIVSASKATLNAERYYEAYYHSSRNPGFQEEFQKVLKTTANQPTLYVMNSQGKMPYLCVAMSTVNTFVSMHQYTICVVLNQNYLEELYYMGDTDENSAFLIFDEEKQLLTSNNSAIYNMEIISSLSTNEVQSDIWQDNEEYMLQIKEINDEMGYYSYIILSDSFWSMLSELRLFSLAGAVSCMIISIFLAYRNTVRAYKPVGNLITRLTAKGDLEYDRYNGNEFDFVTLFLDENDKKKEESKRVHRDWYLLKLLKGNFEQREEEKNIYEKEMAFVSDIFLICILQINSSQEENEDLESFIIQNVFEEIGNEFGKGYVGSYVKDEYVLLINLNSEPEGLKERLRYGQSFCEQYYHIFMTIASSEIHKDMCNISHCYEEALEAIRYQYIFGQGSLISYEQIADRKVNSQLEMESKIRLSLMKYIKSEKRDKSVAQFVDEFLQSNGIHEGASMDRIDFFKREVSAAMDKVIEKCCEEKENLIDAADELLEQPTLLSFRTYLSYLIQEIQKVESLDENDTILIKAKEYIEENYRNSDLSVNMLGEKMQIRGALLSELFREKYGMSLPNYLTYVRIQRAKELLIDKNLTIQEIADQTGFLSSHVFIRNFKKREGITPGRYKDLAE